LIIVCIYLVIQIAVMIATAASILASNGLGQTFMGIGFIMPLILLFAWLLAMKKARLRELEKSVV
jgi:hypothetical protein